MTAEIPPSIAGYPAIPAAKSAAGVTWGGSAAMRAAGLGLGWIRVADRVAERLPADAIERIWLFPPVRRDEREWGTAVVARRVADGRVRIYTASYLMVVRGRDRGQGQVSVEEVGEGPDDVVPDVIRGVQNRAGEAEPPVEIPPALWYKQDDEPASTD